MHVESRLLQAIQALLAGEGLLHLAECLYVFVIAGG